MRTPNRIRRTLFFVFETLKITRNERKTITFLIAMLMLLYVTAAAVDQYRYPSGDNRVADSLFRAKVQAMEAERERIRARYNPPDTASAPLEGRSSASSSSAGPRPDSSSEIGWPVSDRVDLNGATLQSLQRLPGIGPVYARRLLAYRKRVGTIRNPEELLNIRGIGKKRLEKLKPFIKL